MHLAWLVPAAIGAVLGAWNLDHYSWTDPDEIVHANVAARLSGHWLVPMLNDWNIGPGDGHWWWTRVWLHKPILPLWLSALSIKLIGNTPFAFRLPAYLLSVSEIVVVFAIGRRLFDWRVGCAAASMAAVAPFSLALVYGGQFSDIFDIELRFWSTLGFFLCCRCLESNRLCDWAAVGIAVAAAYLTKYELGLLNIGTISAVAGLRLMTGTGVGVVARLGLAVAVFLAIAAPWDAWLAFRFPQEFAQERQLIFSHLSTNVEGWSRPWYFHFWPYLNSQYGEWFVVFIASAVALIGARVLRIRRWSETRADLLLLAPIVGAFVVLSAATSKVPAGTYMLQGLVFIVVARAIVLVSDWVPKPWLWIAITGIAMLPLLDRTSHLVWERSYPDVPVLQLAMQAQRDARFDGACFMFDTRRMPEIDWGYLIDHFQFSFWSGRCAWRVEAGRNDIFLAAKQIRAAGRVPYLVRAGGDCGGRSRRGRLELKEIQPYCVFAVK